MTATHPGAEGEPPERFNFTRDVIERLAGERLSRSALSYVDAEGVIERLTFAEIAARSARWSGLLRANGVKPGDRVLVQVGRRPDWHEIVLACLKTGAVAVPCSLALPGGDLARRTQETEPVLVVADRAAQDRLDGIEDAPPVLFVDDAAELLTGESAVAPTHETLVDDPAFILYTSGATGEPKAVLQTHGFCSAQVVQARRWLGAGRSDRVWCTMDPSWAKAIWNVLLGPWSRGAEVVIDEGVFDASERLELIERLGVTILCQSPPEYRAMAACRDVGKALSGLRRVVSAGDRLDPDVIAEFHDASGHLVRDGYGQTETTLLIGHLLDTRLRPGSIGVAVPGSIVAVIDAHGRTLPPGEEGDLALFGRPPGLFAGYWDDPDETLAAFRGDWYVTGDRATRDEDGFFTLTGRVDDLIVTDADRVNPLVIERALGEDPAVAEVAVVAVPDRDDGPPGAKAFVVLQPRRRPTDTLARRLKAHGEQSVAPGLVLSEVEFVRELPRTVTGKIRRLELRNREFERAGLPVPDRRPTEVSPEDEALLLGEPALIVAALEIRERERRAAEQLREDQERALREEQERREQDELRLRRHAEREAARAAAQLSKAEGRVRRAEEQLHPTGEEEPAERPDRTPKGTPSRRGER